MKKEILSYLDSFVIVVPVYYENEQDPAWRKVFIGTKQECEESFNSFPDSVNATIEENRQNREWKVQEYLLLVSLGKTKKANAIKKQYNL